MHRLILGTSPRQLLAAGAAAASSDYGTRLLLGRLLALSSGHHAILTRWAGKAAGGLPSPVDLDAAGLKLDAYLKEPTS
jgi:hypothetical protein